MPVILQAGATRLLLWQDSASVVADKAAMKILLFMR
jgi:hypothetical protein